MFSFGFSRVEDDESASDTKTFDTSEHAEIEMSRELKFDEFRKVDDCLKDGRLTYKHLKDSLKFIDNIDVVLKLITSDDAELSQIVKAEEKHSDLLPGIYEGGCKIWECTHDMIYFIEKEDIHFSNRKILDLGCGAGLIGITAMMRGAICYFQDYNDEVLKYVTYPNVKINCDNVSDTLDGSKCKYFCGDWQSFLELWQKNYNTEIKFDYILTSETIYNPKNYMKLHDIFQTLLIPQGVIYLAAKTYYFGPGGGLFDFKNLLQEKEIFTYKTVWQNTNGLVREILEIKFK